MVDREEAEALLLSELSTSLRTTLKELRTRMTPTCSKLNIEMDLTLTIINN